MLNMAAASGAQSVRCYAGYGLLRLSETYFLP
jgi:hypothetical protein